MYRVRRYVSFYSICLLVGGSIRPLPVRLAGRSTSNQLFFKWKIPYWRIFLVLYDFFVFCLSYLPVSLLLWATVSVGSIGVSHNFAHFCCTFLCGAFFFFASLSCTKFVPEHDTPKHKVFLSLKTTPGKGDMGELKSFGVAALPCYPLASTACKGNLYLLHTSSAQLFLPYSCEAFFTTPFPSPPSRLSTINRRSRSMLVFLLLIDEVEVCSSFP